MTPKQRRLSLKCAIIGAINGIIGYSCICGTVLTLLCLKFDATEVFIGAITFVVAASWTTRVFTMSTVEKHGKRKVLIFWHSIGAVFIIPFFFLPALAGRWTPAACLALIFIASSLRAIAYGMGSTGWFPLLHDIVPLRLTGRVFANMRVSWQSAYLIALLLIAWLMGDDPQWWKFQIVFIIAFCAYVMRALIILPMSENPMPAENSEKISILARFAEVFAQKELRRVIVYLCTYYLAAWTTHPFRVKLLKDLGYSDGFVLAASAMVGLGAIISLRFWGRLVDRFGNRFIFTLAIIAMPLFTLPWIFVKEDSGVLVLVLFFLWSIFHSGNGIAQTRYMLHAVSPEKQNQINIINVISAFSMGLAPLFGGLFLKVTGSVRFNITGLGFDNYDVLFIISSALFIAPYLLRKSLRQKKDTPTMHVLAIVTRPMLSIFGPFLRTNGRKTKSEE